jgi:hypothetical protein
VSFDWLLISRYALLVALCELIPVPVLDGWVANLVRRRLTHVQLAQHDVDLKGPDVRMLADAGAGGCLGILWSILLWPFKKVLRSVLFVLMINRMVNVASEVAHRALLVHEALEMEALPGDAVAVRAAMNRALAKVDVTVVDKAVFAGLASSRRKLWGALRAGWSRMWSRAGAERRDEEVGEADEAPLPPVPEELSQALGEALHMPGIEAELIRVFRAELQRTGGAEPPEG